MNDPKPLVVFDMDGVLVRERSSWRLVHDALGTSNEDSFSAYMRGDIDDMEFMRRDISLWLQRGVTTLSSVGDILRRATLMNGFEQCMTELRRSGAVLGMISGGLDLLANRLGEEGGFTHVSANGLSVDIHGNLTGEGILRVPLMDKGSILKRLKGGKPDYDPVIAVGDSRVDIPMFQLSDLGIAFRPEYEDVAGSADVEVSDPDLMAIPEIVVEFFDRGRPFGKFQ
ncbi:MAG: HAD-IB family phosphatase [Thermoplasmatota archaeon]